MKKINILLFVAIIAASVMTACKKPDDIKPVISIESPKENQAFPQKKSIKFKATFSDNKELSQYKIDIHIDEDGHGHETLSLVEWDEMLIGELTGSRQIVEREIPVPENAEPGKYHFIVKCVDKAGNEAQEEIDLIILGASN